MVEPSIPECFRLLKVRRGADFSSVKQAYRRNLNKCHPDRFQKRPELIPVAEQKTKRLIQVYSILERWYLENGGVDRAASGEAFPQTPMEANGLDPEEGIVPPRSRRLRVGMAVAAVVAILAALTWWFGLATEEDHKTVLVGGGGTPAGKPASVTPTAVIPTNGTVPPPQPVAQVPAPSASKAAQLSAIVAERDRVKSAWIAGYMHDWGAERDAAQMDFGAAQAQYVTFIRDHAPEIKAAQAETARQADQAKKESLAAKDTIARQLPMDLDALRRAYDDWLLAQGRDAVILVQEIRRRENSDLGVFSDTEDPGKIFEFWTAEEAGGPEISIAAKTGVAVLQPDARFFPHFRTNIFLYNPEGQVLVRMMGSIVEKHDALMKEIEDRKTAVDSELANWDATHPAPPAQLGSSLELAIEGRDRANDRLAKALIRLDRATVAFSSIKANEAFARSPEGKKWADRISATH
jgi:hypothetical protein